MMTVSSFIVDFCLICLMSVIFRLFLYTVSPEFRAVHDPGIWPFGRGRV